MEDQDSIQQAQAEGFPTEDTTPYIGSWVAVRNGKIVASDASLKLLGKHPKIGSEDTFMFIDQPGLMRY